MRASARNPHRFAGKLAGVTMFESGANDAHPRNRRDAAHHK
jgi:hypothetical protein